MPICSVNGADLSYEMAGASGPPLVLVHGAIDDRRIWDMVAAGFARNFRVITYDRRGHGQSQPMPKEDGIAIDVEDLAGLIDALGLAPAYIAGQSAGACLVLQFVFRHPEMVRAVSANEPPLFDLLDDDPELGTTVRSIQEQLAEVRDLLLAHDDVRALRGFFGAVGGHSDIWDMLPQELQQRMFANTETFIYESIDPDFFSIDLSALTRSTVPVLLTSGTQSPPWFTALIPLLAGIMPNASIHSFIGAAHIPMASHPDDYIATLTDFLLRHDPDPV